MDTLARKKTSSKTILLPLSTIYQKNLCPEKQILAFTVDCFLKGLWVQEHKLEVIKVVSQVKMAENHLSVSISSKNNISGTDYNDHTTHTEHIFPILVLICIMSR